ncbi:MAG: DNA polymerase III subunit beta [Bacteroidales bacterium]
MKFVISSSDLLAHLSLMEKAKSSKPTQPILEYTLMELKKGKLSFMASDLETTFISELEVANSEEDGSAAVPKQMLDILKEFPEQPLTFTINQENFTIELSWSTGKASLPSANPKDFPSIPELNGNVSNLTLPSTALSEGITRTIFATGSDDVRPAMSGIYFDLKGDYVTFVATDAHKLVRYTRPDIAVTNKADFILPKKSASVLLSFLNKDDGNVELTFDEKNASFSRGEYRVVCRLIDSNFPAYNSVIPKENPNKAIVNRQEMLAVVKRIATLAPVATSLIRLKFIQGQMTISAQDIDFSFSGTDHINCNYEGNEIEIGFKSSFLREILNNLNTQDVVLEFSDPNRAGLVLPFGEDETVEKTLMLIMPMMI